MPSTPYHIMFLVRLLRVQEGRVRGAAGSSRPATGSAPSPGRGLNQPAWTTGPAPQHPAPRTGVCPLPPGRSRLQHLASFHAGMAASPLSRCRVGKSHQALLCPFTHLGGISSQSLTAAPPASQGCLQPATHPGCSPQHYSHGCRWKTCHRKGSPARHGSPKLTPCLPASRCSVPFWASESQEGVHVFPSVIGGVSANLHFLGCSSRLLLNSKEIFASRPMPK